MSEKIFAKLYSVIEIVNDWEKNKSETRRKLFESAVTKPRNIHTIRLILVCFKQQLVVIQNNVKVKYNKNAAKKKKKTGKKNPTQRIESSNFHNFCHEPKIAGGETIKNA